MVDLDLNVHPKDIQVRTSTFLDNYDHGRPVIKHIKCLGMSKGFSQTLYTVRRHLCITFDF